MQLLSVLLSVTALLAQTASSFYLKSDANTVTGPQTRAAFKDRRIGFYLDPTWEDAAYLVLDADGNFRVESSVGLSDRGDGLWRLEILPPATPDALPRIRGPFTTETGEFVYTGDNEFVWYLCGDGQERLDILLGAPGFVAGENELCQENVKLRVSE